MRVFDPFRSSLAGRAFLALLGVLTLTAVARADIVQKGDVRVRVQGSLSPRTLPRRGTAPVAVAIGGRIEALGGGDPPQLRALSIAINREGRLDLAGLPTCTLREIQPSTSQAALAVCRHALVGEGTFSADIRLPQSSPFPSNGKVLAFNGRYEGHPAILAHVYGTEPVPTSYTLPFTIATSNGTFGTILSTSLPRVTGEWGFVTGIELTLSRRWTAGGHRHSYLSAGCPAPQGFPGATFPLARTSFSFAGGTKVVSTLTRGCRAR